MDDLTRLAPPTPSLAEATVLAPECQASALPSSVSELSNPDAHTPNIVVSAGADDERPNSPETLIPATETLSTRPTRGGVAYPFRLKVEGKEEGDANASTVTLHSLALATPREGEFEKSDVEDGDAGGNEQEEKERPTMERFVTAAVGEVLGAKQDGPVERPGVERFETAQEDLSTIKDADGRP